jgi:hypothetical protein
MAGASKGDTFHTSYNNILAKAIDNAGGDVKVAAKQCL